MWFLKPPFENIFWHWGQGTFRFSWTSSVWVLSLDRFGHCRSHTVHWNFFSVFPWISFLWDLRIIIKLLKFLRFTNLMRIRQIHSYRVFQVKLANCNKLFQIENMDRFLIKWYFDYCKGGEFYMVPQKFRKNLTRHSKSLSKPDFPFCNYCFHLVLYIECYDFDKKFECLARFFSDFFGTI